MSENSRHKRKLSKPTIIICFFAVIFTAFCVFIAKDMGNNAEKMYIHPYTVTNSARTVRSRLLDMKQYVALILTYQYEDEQTTQKIFDERYETHVEALNLMDERYLGPKEDVEAVKKSMISLINAQNCAIDYVEDHTNEEIIDYLEHHVYPLYDEVSDDLDRIISFSDSKINELTVKTKHTAIFFTVIAITLAILIILLSVYSNHTERKVIEELETRDRDLQDALLLAQQASNAKKDFLSHMSHEMRTPLNVIIGMSTIAGTNLDDHHRLEDCFTKIATSSKHLLAIINDVLDMSKIEEGKLSISHETFHLQHLVDSVIAIVHRQIVEQGKRFECTTKDIQHEVLIGDFTRVEQILLNLLSNAIKFTPKGGLIRLDIQEVPENNHQARYIFKVSDTGIGMQEDFIKRIFIPFEQANHQTSVKYGGTGLGMAITHNLVELLNGSIQVESKLHEGSVFTIELPIDVAPNEKKVTACEISTLKVLIVDDEEDTCIHTNLLLNKMGIEAQWVNSGQNAVDKIWAAHEQHRDFDVCFIDWNMPDMDGIEVTRRIREKVGKNTLIIIISAYDWHMIEKDARDAGVNAFVSKPLFESSLYDVLVETTRNHTFEDKVINKVSHSYEGKQILLVEDNELNREIAIALLDGTGVNIDSAEHGQMAVEKFLASKKGEYDLILMDVRMPIMNGYEATTAIRSSDHPDAKTIPILALTANAFKEDVEMTISYGMNGHICKPIDIEVLFQTLDQFLM